MDTPRRRAAGRPAGPPDAPASPAAAAATAAAAAPGEPAAEPIEAEKADPADAGEDPPQHRRRQRAPRTVVRTAEGAAEPNSAEPGPSDGPPAATGASADIVPPEGRVAQDDRRRGESPDREAARDHREPRDHPARDYPARDDRRRGESAMERSLRALVSTRTTQLPFDVAMRAREVAQPSAQDLSEAERDLVLVRRHYVPPAPLITKKADGSGRTGAGRADDAARGDRNDKADRGRGRRSGRG